MYLGSELWNTLNLATDVLSFVVAAAEIELHHEGAVLLVGRVLFQLQLVLLTDPVHTHNLVGGFLPVGKNIQGCAKEMPALKFPPPVRPGKVMCQRTARSANFGMFCLNSLNLVPFLLLYPVVKFYPI